MPRPLPPRSRASSWITPWPTRWPGPATTWSMIASASSSWSARSRRSTTRAPARCVAPSRPGLLEGCRRSPRADPPRADPPRADPPRAYHCPRMAAGGWLREHWAVVAWAIVGLLAAATGIAFVLAQQTLFTPGGWFALDGLRVLDAAVTWQRGGNPYAIPGYLYAPAATLMAVPLASLGGTVAIVAWLA